MRVGTKVPVKSPSELATMREAGRIVARVLALMEERAAPGVTTAELDAAAEELIRSAGAEPSFKGYRGFPATICASVNEEIVHGIPGPRVLREGDLLKVDVGACYEGYHGDATVSVAVAEIGDEASALRRATRRALLAGIGAVREGARVSEIGRAVQRVAERAGFSVVREYTGHGIGRQLHEAPEVLNYVPAWPRGPGVRLVTGNVIAIEPMVNAGTYRTEQLANGWTVVTKDRRLSAHFEHTVAVGEDGPVILTLP